VIDWDASKRDSKIRAGGQVFIFTGRRPSFHIYVLCVCVCVCVPVYLCVCVCEQAKMSHCSFSKGGYRESHGLLTTSINMHSLGAEDVPSAGL